MAASLLSKSFGEVIRARRCYLKLTQEQVAEKANIHATYVGMVERGERNCSLDIADALGRALEMPASKLIAQAETLTVSKEKSGSKKGKGA